MQIPVWFKELQPDDPWIIISAIFLLITVSVIFKFLRHPLRNIPGPWLARLLPGWIAYYAFRDSLQEAVLRAHGTYGDVVCVGPDTVLARSPEAVLKVLGYGSNHLRKSSDYAALVFHTPSVFSETDKQAHTRKRRVVAQAYSMNNIVKLEGFVDANIDKFTARLRASVHTGEALDLCEWFKYYAFDVIGDLAFGSTFGMLDRGTTGEFVTQISEGIEYTFVLFLLPPILRPLRRFLARWKLPGLSGSKEGFQFVQKETSGLVASRWKKYNESGTRQRSDILGALMDAKDPRTGEKMAFLELATNASTNVVAGSDTLTITLTSIVYFLLRNPACTTRLVSELDEALESEALAVKDVLGLPYLDACIKESMRLVAPFGGPMPRVSPPGGLKIGKYHIPENVNICVMHDAVHRDERVYEHANAFCPERWLASSKGEELEQCFLGFSAGPRSCLGKNVALLEMKKLLVRLFTEFDLSLLDEHADLSCRRYLVTKSRDPMFVRMKRRERGNHNDLNDGVDTLQ